MNLEIRNIFAQRLKEDLQRKKVKVDALAAESGLDKSVINAYLRSSRTLNIGEAQKLCKTLGLNIFRVFAKEYSKISLIYRGAGRDKCLIQMEDSLSYVAELCPKPQGDYQEKIDISDKEATMLLTQVINYVNSIKSKLGAKVEDLYKTIKLSIILLPDVGQYEAFIFRKTLKKEAKALVCINRAYLRKPSRLHFSLLHELAHFVFCHEGEVESFATGEGGGLYDDVISLDTVNEFMANKFAQEFIFSFAEAVSFSKKPENINKILAEKVTSIDVLANAMYDVERRQSTTKSLTKKYNQILSELKQKKENYQHLNLTREQEIVNFVQNEHNKTQELIKNNKKYFSETVFKKICDDLALVLV